MEFQFEQNLPHQQRAVDKVLQVVNAIESENSLDYASNKIFFPKDDKIKEEIKKEASSTCVEAFRQPC